MSSPPPGSIDDERQVLVPIRMVESLRYCPRQAWYRFTLGDDPLNVHMERGLRRHATMDEAAPESHPGEAIFRHLPVDAPELGVQGVIDKVVIGPDGTRLTEYKAAKTPRTVWDGIATQVMVQALALREHAASGRWLGPPLTEPVRLRVYFADSRRYRDVPWTTETDRRARQAVAAARAILESTTPPAGNVGPRCANCQHEPICLPFDLPRWLAAGGEETATAAGEHQR